MNTCPCCSNQLLRHARHKEIYWFCSHCWQEMPDFTSLLTNRRERVQQLERLIDIYNPPMHKQPLKATRLATTANVI